jgi:hypothetical protein
VKRSVLKLLVLVLALGVLGIGILPANAVARSRATVSWSLPRTANEGAPISFSWSAKHLGRNHRLVIQRPFGTARVWKSIIRLPADSGSAELPGQSLGFHRFRIAAFRGRQLLAQQTSRVEAFGEVPFTILFANEHPDVYTTPSHSFSYVRSWGGIYEKQNLFGVKNNHCSSVHIAFVPGNHNEPGVGTLTVVQESRDPVGDSVPHDAIGSVDTELTPGQTWGVNVSVAGTEGGPTDFYINGDAICDSREPFSE